MKTLEQLWIENGEKAGLKVSAGGYHSTILARASNGTFALESEQGSVFIITPDEPALWSLYQEPKPRRLACIYQNTGRMELGCLYFFTQEEFEGIKLKNLWERAPWLDEPEEKK